MVQGKNLYLMKRNNKTAIVPFQPKYKSYFVDLNLDWLNEYFEVEANDEEVLYRCEEEIILKGGFIFFAKIDNEIVGTYSLLKLSYGVFELTKMAVDKQLRGKGIGSKLMNHCLQFAKENQFEKLILYSNTSLENAIHLYRKFGFVEIPFEHSPYERGDIKMEYVMSNN